MHSNMNVTPLKLWNALALFHNPQTGRNSEVCNISKDVKQKESQSLLTEV